VKRTLGLRLLEKRGLDNAEKAVLLLRESLKKDPDNAAIKLELADALNMMTRIRTNGNSLVIEGTQDSPAFKKVWQTFGNEALPLATDAREAFPHNVKALAVYADAFMFSSSAKGIIKQALTGAGTKYLAIAKELYKYPEFDGAVGCAFLGGFYAVAPWPVGSKGKAAKYLGEGAQRWPTRRNLYYVGVISYQTGEYGKAVHYFRRSMLTPISREPTSTEVDIADFLLEQAKRGLDIAQTALASNASDGS
jgi:tetratricopeptide (TPR) repeat protein